MSDMTCLNQILYPTFFHLKKLNKIKNPKYETITNSGHHFSRQIKERRYEEYSPIVADGKYYTFAFNPHKILSGL